jgi:electron transfer flavoprotein beta subunit
VLAAAIRRLEPYDAILCGECSSDLFNQQTASRLAALLRLPCLSLVNQLHIDGRTITATRKLADCTKRATVEGPVVISVRNDINRPRIPTLKQILGAARKPTEEIRLSALDISPEDLLPKAVRRSVQGFVMTRKANIYKDGSAADKVARLLAGLAGDNLL